MKKAEMIQAGRLTIRPYQKEDEDSIFPVINDRHIYETTLNIPYPYPREQVAVWLHFTIKNIEYKRGYEYGIFKEGRYIGNVGIVNIDPVNNSGEITYFIGSEHLNKGYATQAVGAMLHFGFEKLKLERIQGRCMVHNEASKRVMEKAGFQYEGIFRHEVVKCGRYIDVYHAAILKQDYSASQS